MSRLKFWRFLSCNIGFILIAGLLASCGGDNPPAPVPGQGQPSSSAQGLPTTGPVATATTAPTPTPQPTATLGPLPTNEWGTVKSTGAEVKAAPSAAAPTLEKLNPFTVLAWQQKLPDESWFERAGGGWIRHDDVVVFRTESEAKRNVPAPTATSKPIPTFNPNPAQVGRAAYTFAPIAGTAAAAQYITVRAPTPTPTIPPLTATAQAKSSPTATPIVFPTVTAGNGKPAPTPTPGGTDAQ